MVKTRTTLFKYTLKMSLIEAKEYFTTNLFCDDLNKMQILRYTDFINTANM